MRLDPRDRAILALAVPALGALVAEPLFLLADAAVVGTLGTAQLAGLGAAGTVLATTVGLCVFLAYGTTAVVARRLGAGRADDALRLGADALWLGLVLGLALVVVGELLATALVAGLGASATAAPFAGDYLRVSLLGLPAVLVSFAAIGLLRGLQDTRTPLVITVVTASLNLVLDLWFVLGLHHGVAGSAWATVLAQAIGAAAYVAVVVRRSRPYAVSWWPDLAGVRETARLSGPLLLRTLALRAVFIVSVSVAAHAGDADLAAYHVSLQVWLLLSLALDALAIAGQALVGRDLGASDVDAARQDLRRLLQWGIGAGFALAGLVVLLAPLLPAMFSADPAVRSLLTASLLVVAVHQPVAGPVFVLDGVLIGAGDATWLAGAGAVTLVAFVPAAALVRANDDGVVALWWALLWFMVVRLALLAYRARGDTWLRTGASLTS
ncbi:MAG: MATE family efflux transporter [Actinomycetes bacterium]